MLLYIRLLAYALLEGPLKERIFCIIAEELGNKNFDEKEFQLARESFYYRHIPFDQIKVGSKTREKGNDHEENSLAGEMGKPGGANRNGEP